MDETTTTDTLTEPLLVSNTTATTTTTTTTVERTSTNPFDGDDENEVLLIIDESNDNLNDGDYHSLQLLTSFQTNIKRLRYFTIIATLLTLLWECIKLPSQIMMSLFLIHPGHGIITCYIIFFCILLLCVEVLGNERPIIRDNFGILYHPLGRGFFLVVVLSPMCYVNWHSTTKESSMLKVKNSLLVFSMISFSISGICHVYFYLCKYRRYQQRWIINNDNQTYHELRNATTTVVRRTERQVTTAATSAIIANAVENATASLADNVVVVEEEQ